MKNLENLLQRFRNSLFADENRKKIISETIKKHIQADISANNLFYKEGILEIEASAVMKNSIKLKESGILDELKANSINISRVLYK